MGKIVSSVGQKLGVIADPNAGAGARGAQEAMLGKAAKMIEDIKVPEIQDQVLDLLKDAPQLVGLLEAEQIGPTELANIAVDPKLREQTMDSLQGMQELAETGFSTEDRARMEALRRQSAADEKARQDSILAEMSQRGTLDSGMQLAAQLASSQAQSDRAQQQALELGAQSAAARRQALQQAGQMAQDIGSEDFRRDASAAQAQDLINRFNAGQRADTGIRNLQSRQNIENKRSGLAVQQQIANKGLLQQDFGNQLRKASALTGSYGAQANFMGNQAQRQAQAAQQQAAFTRGVIGGAVTGGAGAAGLGASGATGWKGALGAFAADGGIKGQEYFNGGMKLQAGADGSAEGSMVDSTGQNYYDALEARKPNNFDDLVGMDKARALKKAQRDAYYDAGGASGTPLVKETSNVLEKLGNYFGSKDSSNAEASLGKTEVKSPIKAKGGMTAKTPKRAFFKELDQMSQAQPQEMDYSRALSFDYKPQGNLMAELARQQMAGMSAADGGIMERAKELAERADSDNDGIMERAKSLSNKVPLSEFRKDLDTHGATRFSNDLFFNKIKLTPDQILMLRQKEYEESKGTSNENISKKMLLDTIDRTMNIQNNYANGGMNYEAGGQGTIIDSGEENYAGDELPDRINDGEMVLNVEQQQFINDALKELAMRRDQGKRIDDSLDEGELTINPEQQSRLMAAIRQEIPVEELGKGDIVEQPESGLQELIKRLS